MVPRSTSRVLPRVHHPTATARHSSSVRGRLPTNNLNLMRRERREQDPYRTHLTKSRYPAQIVSHRRRHPHAWTPRNARGRQGRPGLWSTIILRDILICGPKKASGQTCANNSGYAAVYPCRGGPCVPLAMLAMGRCMHATTDR